MYIFTSIISMLCVVFCILAMIRSINAHVTNQYHFTKNLIRTIIKIDKVQALNGKRVSDFTDDELMERITKELSN